MIIKRKLKTSENIQQPAMQQILDAPLEQPLQEVQSKSPEIQKEKQKTELDTIEEFEKIDISEIEFKERVERRRGDRRKGYRRIDERALVSRAQEEARSIRELAAKEGYKTGLENAQKEVERLKAALEDFLSSKYEIYDELMPHILEISLEVAKKIIKKEVELSDDVLKNIINEVLGELTNSDEKITIKVAPDDADFARASLPEIIQTNRLDAKVAIVPDDSIEKGSCVVVSSNGVVDANFSTQLQIIQNAFGIYKGGQ